MRRLTDRIDRANRVIPVSNSGDWGSSWTPDSGFDFGSSGIAVLDPTTLKRGQRKPETDDPYSDEQDQRVVVVCPYSQLNIYFESEIPRHLRDCEVDIISMAEIDEHPYIDISEREDEKPVPFWIIDFQKIIAEEPLTVVSFDAYKNWASNGRTRTTYLFPTPRFVRDLEKRHEYDEDGNFESAKVRTADFYSDITTDLKKLRAGLDEFSLFRRGC
ncbi:hypothetical protein GF386_05660 [Candidatus Pacearchaeota archaeon]|nr:hypothetical protein [Candidatus Pacearchaeota archaeon]MBD3283581.1 hypothetical protein [Candidatus Pacearchaeota archaeon]